MYPSPPTGERPRSSAPAQNCIQAHQLVSAPVQVHPLRNESKPTNWQAHPSKCTRSDCIQAHQLVSTPVQVYPLRTVSKFEGWFKAANERTNHHLAEVSQQVANQQTELHKVQSHMTQQGHDLREDMSSGFQRREAPSFFQRRPARIDYVNRGLALVLAGCSLLHTSTNAGLHCPGFSHFLRHFFLLKHTEQMPSGRSTPTSQQGRTLALGDTRMAALGALTSTPHPHSADLSHMARTRGLQLHLRRHHLVRTLPGSSTPVRTVAILGRVCQGGFPAPPLCATRVGEANHPGPPLTIGTANPSGVIGPGRGGRLSHLLLGHQVHGPHTLRGCVLEEFLQIMDLQVPGHALFLLVMLLNEAHIQQETVPVRSRRFVPQLRRSQPAKLLINGTSDVPLPLRLQMRCV